MFFHNGYSFGTCKQFYPKKRSATVAFLVQVMTMAQDFARAFYDSPAWRSTRESYKKYRRGLCEDCLRKGIITAGTEVHHIKPLTPQNITDVDVALSFDNLALLCHACHTERHATMDKSHRAGRKKAQRRYFVDSRGIVAPLCEGDV